MRASIAVDEGRTPMIPLNTQLGLPSRAFWYIALRSLVLVLLVVVLGSIVQLVTSLPGATCGGHACNPASGAHLAAFIYLFAAFLVVRAVLNFKWYSFVVTDRNLTIDSGVLSRTSNVIRYDRIQDVSTRRDPLHALLGLKSVDIWTASPDQFAGNRRRPEGHLVLDTDDADWLRDYLSQPPAAATPAAGGGARPTSEAALHGGNGAVVMAMLIAAALVVLAAIAATKRSPPMPPGSETTSVTPSGPSYVSKRGADGRMHLHPVRSAPAQLPQVAVTPAPASAALPPAPVSPPTADYGIACAIQPQQPTGAVRACATLPIAERCSHEMDFPSHPTAEPATVTVVNKSAESVKFYWLNQAGNRALYATLAPGGRLDQPSHLGAHWLFASADGQCLGVLDAATVKVGIF